MKISVIGSGNVGGTLGADSAKHGHQVTFGIRDVNDSKMAEIAKAADGNVEAKLIVESIDGADVIALTVPWSVAEDVIKSLGDLSGRIVLDCMNPIGPGFQLTHGHTTSGGEKVAEWAVGANVVKIFNTTGFENMADPIYADSGITMLYCGDETESKKIAHQLASDLGFDPVDFGGLKNARYLEPYAIVWISLSQRPDLGRTFAISILKR